MSKSSILGIIVGLYMTITSGSPYIIIPSLVIVCIGAIYLLWDWPRIAKSLRLQVGSAFVVVLICIGTGYLQWPEKQPTPPTAEEIAKEVVKKLPNKPNAEEKHPSFIVEPRLIMGRGNEVLSLDIKFTNIGMSPANFILLYSLIIQGTPLALIVHPQSCANNIMVGQSKVIHEPSAKMLELTGEQYLFLYLHYTDLNSKKKYSQTFYFERVIYKAGFTEYSDASIEHKRFIDEIRKGNYGHIEDLINSGADEAAFLVAMKKLGYEVKNITDF